ncbi:MAG: NAD(P)H-hydrate dehydratase [Cytophagales bacterium]|nr:NAD(P)H-hydrate dehydratase [Cytophagales bacterium]
MKIILSTRQIQQADQYTIENEPIASIDLMERASMAFVQKFKALYLNLFENILIFCGTGNNGGDGLAIARLLCQGQQKVHVFTIGDLENGSPDFKINLDRLPKEVVTSHLHASEDFPEINAKTDGIIDGIFGSGLTRIVLGIQADLINHINSFNAPCVSIDIASGLFADKPVGGDAIVQPNHTISFQVPKLAFMQPALHQYVGEWHVVDIGLNEGFISSLESEFKLTEVEEMRRMIPRRGRFSHKGDAGRLLIIAGSLGKMGAAILVSQASFRAGAGLVYIHSPACGLDILQSTIPEAMVMIDSENEIVSDINVLENITVIAIGPGIGTNDQTSNALHQLILNSTIPLILDADALNILADHPDWMADIPFDSILTPHPGEFKRLVGEWANDFDKLEKLKAICINNNLNVVLKGANSAVCDKDGNVYFNSTGNPGMATAGSGDVLTGIIAGLYAQGLEPINSLRLGVYLHGLAGDHAVEQIGELSLKASDIIDRLVNSILSLSRS